MYLLENAKSSLIREIEYWEDEQILTVRFIKYFVDELTYYDVPFSYFEYFGECPSIGQYYLQMIKPNFKTTNMANKPKGVNRSSNKKRFIKLTIDVRLIKKEWLHVGEKGTYAQLTLMMLPDGEVDRYDNLGMIVMDVPKHIREKDKDLKGPILGNGFEALWENSNAEAANVEDLPPAGDEVQDDLPF